MSFQAILVPSSSRVFPGAPLPSSPLRSVDAALNERLSFQLALRNDDPGAPLSVRIEASAPGFLPVRIRRAGLVPVPHFNTPVLSDPADRDGVGSVPGFVPDPLFDESSFSLPPLETHAFWLTVLPTRRAVPGVHAVKITVVPASGRPRVLTLSVHLYPVALHPRRDFFVTQWFYADSLIDYYKTDLFDSRFWKIVAPYFRDLAEHGQNSVYVPVFTPPLDGVKRPTQLLRVAPPAARGGRYRFDWRDVRAYVRSALAQGVTDFEWCHPFSQWGVKFALRVYRGQGAGEKLLWPAETPALSPVYRGFLAQYLPALKRFLDSEGILRHSRFHVSDEPSAQCLENYRAARSLLRELAPWMRTMDALSEIEFAPETDLPLPGIRTAPEFIAKGFDCGCYFCCGPRGRFLNRLMDTPLAKIAMSGLLFYRWPFKGFLHWGYNYWYFHGSRTMIDPFAETGAGGWPNWAYGDPFEVYPGPDGPIDSIRWETFGESLQDYALLQTLGVSRDDRRLAPLRSFEDFPKSAAWRASFRRSLLRSAK